MSFIATRSCKKLWPVVPLFFFCSSPSRCESSTWGWTVGEFPPLIRFFNRLEQVRWIDDNVPLLFWTQEEIEKTERVSLWVVSPFLRFYDDFFRTLHRFRIHSIRPGHKYDQKLSSWLYMLTLFYDSNTGTMTLWNFVHASYSHACRKLPWRPLWEKNIFVRCGSWTVRRELNLNPHCSV